MALASVSGLLIWTMSQSIENRQKERRLDAGKSVRNEIWRTVSTFASDPTILRTVGLAVAAGKLTGAADKNLARCLGFINDDVCRQTSAVGASGVFDSGTNEFRAANEITLAVEDPPGSGTLVYYTRPGSSPVYYSVKGERDCSRGKNCLLVARAGFFATCRNNTATCTAAESVTTVVQVKHVTTGMTADDLKSQQHLAFSAFPSNTVMAGAFSKWDKFSRKLAVTDIRGDWGCPVGSFPTGLRQPGSTAVNMGVGLPVCSCYWETYPTLSSSEKTSIRSTLTMNSDNHPTDCAAKLNTWMAASPALICPAAKPIFVGYHFALNPFTGQQEPVLDCTTFGMTANSVGSGANSNVNCAATGGATTESRVCGLTVSTCTMDAAKKINCSDANIGCCTPN